jgi:glyoxylase-like metal-dependent hydrolase (beta-lactamase superfamily II)
MKITISLFATIIFISATAQEPQMYITFQAGEFTVSILSEGGRQGNASLLKGATDEQIKKYLPDGSFPLETQVFLVRTPERNILVDAGYGINLFKNLTSLGLSENQIDVILLTHLHGDHIGGLLREGLVAFPNAEVYLSKKEYDYWMNLGERGASQQKALNAYKAKLHIFEPYEPDNQGKEIVSGITPIAAYGHTPGHTAFLVKSEGAKWMIYGDLTHAMPIQMPCPQVAVNFDLDAAEAIKARQKLLDYIFENKMVAGGMHVPFPAMGFITKSKTEGYIYNPICLCEGI